MKAFTLRVPFSFLDFNMSSERYGELRIAQQQRLPVNFTGFCSSVARMANYLWLKHCMMPCSAFEIRTTIIWLFPNGPRSFIWDAEDFPKSKIERYQVRVGLGAFLWWFFR